MNKARCYLLICLLMLANAGIAYAQSAPCTPTKNYLPIAERLTEKPTLLFKIKRCGLPVSYIFGTFHSDAPALTGIYHQATGRLQKTKQLALEVVMDDAMRAAARAALTTRSTDPTLEQVAGQTLYATLKEKVAPRLGLDEAQLQRHKPWALAVLLQYPKAEGDGVVLDEKLQRFAESWGLNVLALETVEQQLRVFDQMSKPMQLDFLASTLDDFDTLNQQHDKLKSLYEAQNLQGIYDMSEALFAEMDKRHPELAAYLRDRVLVRRNRHMASRMQHLMSTSSFFAVGALHLPGDEGVLKLLEARGYEIFPIATQ